MYYRHDELEYGVPFELYQQCLAAIRKLLIELRYPLIIEVRFTPKHSAAMLGPGTGPSQRTAYLEITPSMSRPTDEMFKAVEQILLQYQGRPHFGKKTYVDRGGLRSIYSTDVLDRFEAARSSQDPGGKFLNEFTERLFI